jgi:hypothetical protein
MASVEPQQNTVKLYLYKKRLHKEKKLVFVAGKLFVLDGLLRRLKEEGHRH